MEPLKPKKSLSVRLGKFINTIGQDKQNDYLVVPIKNMTSRDVVIENFRGDYIRKSENIVKEFPTKKNYVDGYDEIRDTLNTFMPMLSALQDIGSVNISCKVILRSLNDYHEMRKDNRDILRGMLESKTLLRKALKDSIDRQEEAEAKIKELEEEVKHLKQDRVSYMGGL